MNNVVFFNNKGGVGKTSLVYHTAWMFSEFGYRTLIADLDPQSNLTSIAIGEKRFRELLSTEKVGTFFEAVSPIFNGTGDVLPIHIEPLSDRLGLLAGNLSLSVIEDDISIEWPKCFDGRERAFRVVTSFWRVIREAAERHSADIVFIDVAPNFGALNRAILTTSSHIIFPVYPDFLSLQGLKNTNHTLQIWRNAWTQITNHSWEKTGIPYPSGGITPIGCIITKTPAYHEYWDEQILETYKEINPQGSSCLYVNYYPDLMSATIKQHKPMFNLTEDESSSARQDFLKIAKEIANQTRLEINLSNKRRLK